MILMIVSTEGGIADTASKALGAKNVVAVQPGLCLISVSTPDDVEDPCLWTRDRIPVLRHLPGTTIVVEIGNMAGGRNSELRNTIEGWDPDTMADLSDDAVSDTAGA